VQMDTFTPWLRDDSKAPSIVWELSAEAATEVRDIVVAGICIEREDVTTDTVQIIVSKY